MKTRFHHTWFIVAMIAGGFAGSRAAAEDIALKDGRVFADAKIMSQSPTTVMIRHASGMSSVSKTLLPEALASKYPVDEAAAAREKEAEEARVVRSLTLTNGRVLQNAWITTESPDRVWIKHDLGAGWVSKELLPPALLARYPIDERALQEAKAKAAAEQKAQQRAVTDHKKRAKQDQADEQKLLERVAEKARNHAENYFRFERRPGSGEIHITNLKLDMEPPTRVLNSHPPRYEIEGKCFMEYYDSVGRSFSYQKSQAFVVAVEDEGGVLTVADLSFHYAPR